MTIFCRKLKSTSGASIVIALVYFLLCLTVGAVIMTAATASAGRINRVTDEQQAYFAVRSAAELLRDDLAGKRFEATYEQHIGGDSGSGQIAGPTTYVIKDAACVNLAEKISERAKYLFYQDIDPEPTLPTGTKDTITFDVRADSISKDIPEVRAGYQIDDNYRIVIRLDTADAKYQCPVTLTIEPTIARHTEQRTETWLGEAGDEGEDPPEMYEVIQRDTIKIVWQQGTITKGHKEGASTDAS